MSYIYPFNNKGGLTLACFIETDKTFPKESRRRAEDILEEIKATYHVQLFSGVSHGFGTRGDPEVENSRMLLFFFIVPQL